MATKSRTVEVTVISAEGLRVRGNPANKNVFAVVRAESLTAHTTPTANGNNGLHTWNQKFAVELGPHARCVTFELKSKTGTGEKDIGVARIAISDFLGGLVPDHCLQFLCYGLRDWEGRRNGIVNFSVRVVAPPPPAACGVVGDSCGFRRLAENDECSTCMGVVTGIPVWWNTTASN